jgi:hypothetical protein
VNKHVELIDQAMVGLESLLLVVQEGSCNALPAMCTHSEIPARGRLDRCREGSRAALSEQGSPVLGAETIMTGLA